MNDRLNLLESQVNQSVAISMSVDTYTKAEFDAVLTREAAAMRRVQKLEAELARRLLADSNDVLSGKLQQLERDIDVYRDAKQSLELAVLDNRSRWKHAEDRAVKLQSSPSYKLGELLIGSFGTWRDTFRLPARIVRWYREYRGSPVSDELAPSAAGPEYAYLSEISLRKASEDGLEVARKWVEDQRPRAAVLSRVLLDLAGRARSSDPSLVVPLARAAVDADPNEGRVKHLAFCLMDAGSIEEAGAILQSALRAGATFNPAEARRHNELMALERLKSQGVKLPEGAFRNSNNPNPKILIYTPQSLPFHWSSTSMRTHAMAQTLKDQGCVVEVVTYPGYPNRADPASAPVQSVVEGVVYRRLPAVDASPSIVDEYSRQTGLILWQTARQFDADAIITECSLEAAYPAAIATRMSGASLVLDYLRVSQANEGASEKDMLLREVGEALKAQANIVLARWPASVARLADGASHEKVLLLGESSPTFSKRSKTQVWRVDPALQDRLVIGYVGDPYDDIDLEAIAEAFDSLVTSGMNLALAVFGVGTRFLKLHDSLNLKGHAERVLFPGRPKVDAIGEAFDAIDIFVAPRREEAEFAARARFELVDALNHGKIIVATEEAAAQGILGEAAVWTGDGRDSLVEALRKLADPVRRSEVEEKIWARRAEWQALSSVTPLVDRIRNERIKAS